MSDKSRAIRPEDVTKEEAEEALRQVRDLVNYMANYDSPEFKKRLGKIDDPQGVLMLVQSGPKKFERGLADTMTLVAVGEFNPENVAIMIRGWLIQSMEMAQLGREIV